MLKLDLHVHTKYSDDATGSPMEIIRFLRKKGFQGVAITDHNNIRGAIKALKNAPKDFIVIPGVEISTRDGHLLGLNLKNEIKKNLTVEETVEEILDNGGLPVVPHLFRKMSGIKIDNLGKIQKKIGALEVFNACSLPRTNIKISEIAEKLKTGGTGGSDTHVPMYAGYGYTTVDLRDGDAEDVISQISKKKTWGEGMTMPLSYRSDRMVKSIKQYFKRGFKRV